jgi:prophage regulatory protein
MQPSLKPRYIATPKPLDRFVRMPEVVQLTGLSRRTIYRMIKEETFPQQHKLSRASVGWWLSSIKQWQTSRTKIQSPASH